MFDGVLDWLSENLNNILAIVVQLLPASPFQFSLPKEVEDILGYINWFVPFDLISNAMFVWTLAVLGYYAYMVVLRWLKALQ